MGPSELLEHVVAVPVWRRLFPPMNTTCMHLRDITGLLLTAGADVDRPYIARWAEQPGLGEIWETIVKRLRS